MTEQAAPLDVEPLTDREYAMTILLLKWHEGTEGGDPTLRDLWEETTDFLQGLPDPNRQYTSLPVSPAAPLDVERLLESGRAHNAHHGDGYIEGACLRMVAAAYARLPAEPEKEWRAWVAARREPVTPERIAARVGSAAPDAPQLDVRHYPHLGNHDDYACAFDGPHCWGCGEPWPCSSYSEFGPSAAPQPDEALRAALTALVAFWDDPDGYPAKINRDHWEVLWSEARAALAAKEEG